MNAFHLFIINHHVQEKVNQKKRTPPRIDQALEVPTKEGMRTGILLRGYCLCYKPTPFIVVYPS